MRTWMDVIFSSFWTWAGFVVVLSIVGETLIALGKLLAIAVTNSRPKGDKNDKIQN